MTDQQKYDIFIAKLGDKIREVRKDYSELSAVNQMQFEQLCQTVLAANGVVIASEIVQKILNWDR